MEKIKQDLQRIIENLRPALQRDGGDIELVGITDDYVVEVRLRGACHGCPMAALTLKDFIEKQIKKEIPEIKSVEAV